MTVNNELTGLKIAVIGVGNMGCALVRGLVEKSVYPQNIIVYDVDPKKIAALKKDFSVKVAKTGRQCVSLADVVILAVKPQIMQAAVDELASGVDKGALVLSIAAGLSIAKIEGYFKRPLSIVRVMPNMPALVGAGMSAFSLGKRCTPRHRRITEAVLWALGTYEIVPEKSLDLVTALSGSGPAYFFLLAEKMIEAAYEAGMKVDIAKRLVYQTAFGSGRVLIESGEDPETLIGRVASKGGTTEAALKMFQRNGFGKLVRDAVRAAERRSKELREGK